MEIGARIRKLASLTRRMSNFAIHMPWYHVRYIVFVPKWCARKCFELFSERVFSGIDFYDEFASPTIT